MTASEPRLGVVERRQPQEVLQRVSQQTDSALRQLYSTGRSSPELDRYLGQLHEAGQWLVCDCQGTGVAPEKRPAMTLVRNARDKLYLRNLPTRDAHAEGCPFGYHPAPRRHDDPNSLSDGPIDTGTPNWLAPLNLHRPSPAAVRREAPQTEKGDAGGQHAMPTLGATLLHLIELAGFHSQGAEFDYLAGLDKLRQAASLLTAYPQAPLSEVLRLSVRHEDALIRDIEQRRTEAPGAYGLLVAVVHDIDRDIPVLIRQQASAGEPAEFGKNRTLTVQASRPRLTVAC